MDVRRAARGARRRIGRAAEVLQPSRVVGNALVQLNVRSHRTWALPIPLYAPTSRCNSRCASCEYWRTDGATDLTREEVAAVCRDLPRLRTKLVVFTGGEPLVREDVFELADMFRAEGVALHLLTAASRSNATPPRWRRASRRSRFRSDSAHPGSLSRHPRRRTASPRSSAASQAQGAPAGAAGARAIDAAEAQLPGAARARLDKAGAMGLDDISFLTADVTSGAFGRERLGMAHSPRPGARRRRGRRVRARDSEGARQPRARLPRRARGRARRPPTAAGARYYRAHARGGPFPEVRCNAPWVSAVVESNGTGEALLFPAGGRERAAEGAAGDPGRRDGPLPPGARRGVRRDLPALRLLARAQDAHRPLR